MTINEPDVLRIRDVGWDCVESLLQPAGLSVVRVEDGQPIPGSHWGDEEAGLIGHNLYVRSDTPVHSALHESGHWLLMSEQRREALHTDAKGTAVEEMAVCYLQVLMGDLVPNMGWQRMCRDMDSWGYSFRLGSTLEWLRADAEDALACLTQKLSHAHGVPGLDVTAPYSRIFQQHDDGGAHVETTHLGASGQLDS